ncbi:MAG: hypothetical protein H6642_00655 [Caldilineaceae bacterium]|nr:hypothetical protein [Caldilineaceae bacterium]
MIYIRSFWVNIGFAIVVLLILEPQSAHAQYMPPGDITLTIYSLTESDGSMFDPPIPCDQNNPVIKISYGCTAFAGDEAYAYPFDSSTITIGMETHMHDGVQQGYLHNVVPSETNPQNHHPLSVKTQAIAARSHAYFEMAYPTCADGSAEITNSNSDQVYLPFMYALQPDAAQAVVDQAVADRYYMSYAQDIQACGTTIGPEQPIFSEFSADAFKQTIDHPEMATKYPYMRGVADPISNHPDIQLIVDTTNAHERGYSQNGASRWANGNQTSDPNGDLGAWSVQWTTPAQILTHYYTGIQIRNAANSGNAIMTPDLRWVPLSISPLSTWSDSLRLCKNRDVSVTVDVQNAGLSDWDTATAELGYHASWYTGSATPISAAGGSAVISPGANSSFTFSVPVPNDVSPGAYVLELDMCRTGASGSGGNCRYFSEDGWPRYPVNVEVVEECSLGTFLPIIIQDIAVQ